MKKHHLVYLLLILAFAACKKTESYFPDENKLNTGSTDVNNGTTPTDLTTEPKLADFKINNAACAFDSTTNAYYYPVQYGGSLSGYTVTFDTTLAKAVYFDNTRIKNGGIVNDNILHTNENITIKAVNSLNTSVSYKLIITGLPMITLTTNSTIGDAKINASFNLIDPDYQLQGHKLLTSSNIQIGVRGASSRYYPKQSYSVGLVNASGADVDISLLGLREDNKWILDAMYIDQSRMRNRVCTDIWNSFNNVPHIASEPQALNGTRGNMTEVFLNNKYLGLYCLTERLDRKQLKIKKQYGNMYKADDWSNEVYFAGLSAFDNSNSTWGGWELTYPEIGDSPSPDWSYLYNVVYFISSASDEDFDEQIKNKVDIDNMVDYFIFMNTIEGLDNAAKNTFFSMYDSRTAPQFFYSVWDLDGTMGRNWDGSVLTNAAMGASGNNLFKRLLTLNAANFKQLVKDRWNTLKSNQLSKTVVAAKIEAYRKLLVSTDAFARERAVWTNINQDLNTEAEYMRNWYSGQYDLIDQYFNNL